MKTDMDSLLKQWNARHAPGTEHLDRMADRISVEAARRRYLGCLAPAATGMTLWGKWVYGTLGACAAILVMAIVLGHFGKTSARESGASLAGLAKPSAVQVGTFQELFAETTRLFPKQLRWIVQSNGDIGLGVESGGNSDVADTPVMLVRLVLVKRVAGEKTWKPAWTTDIVMRGEDRVEIATNLKGHNKVTLWLYPLDKGMVAVDTSIAIDQPLRVSARLDTVVGMGVPTEVAASAMGGDEYKVLQTVQPLEEIQGRKS